jgi:hypothetical protein
MAQAIAASKVGGFSESSQGIWNGWSESEVLPEIVLPAQLGEGASAAFVHGERRLMLAVLEQAVRDFAKYLPAERGHRRRLFHDVEGWFESDDTSWPYTFTNICDVLDIDSEYVLTRLRKVRDSYRARPVGKVTLIRQFRRRTPSLKQLSVGGAQSTAA